MSTTLTYGSIPETKDKKISDADKQIHSLLRLVSEINCHRQICKEIDGFVPFKNPAKEVLKKYFFKSNNNGGVTIEPENHTIPRQFSSFLTKYSYNKYACKDKDCRRINSC